MKELVRDRVYKLIQQFPGITDRELSERLGKLPAHINQECRVLEMEGKICRRLGAGNRAKGNYPVQANLPMEVSPAVSFEWKVMLSAQSGGTISVCGYEFRFLQDIQPERDEYGEIKRYYPQSCYEKRDSLPLSRYGHGAFCRFSITAPPVPGVYLWVVDDKIIYIGEAVNLRQRFNSGYGNISPRNCYVGGQNTNCRMNKVLLELCEAGKQIKLYFFQTAEHKKVELELLRQIKTPYNVKDN